MQGETVHFRGSGSALGTRTGRIRQGDRGQSPPLSIVTTPLNTPFICLQPCFFLFFTNIDRSAGSSITNISGQIRSRCESTHSARLHVESDKPTRKAATGTKSSVTITAALGLVCPVVPVLFGDILKHVRCYLCRYKTSTHYQPESLQRPSGSSSGGSGSSLCLKLTCLLLDCQSY